MLTAMGELLTEQMLLLEEIAGRPSPWTTREQTVELLREVKKVRRLLEQTGKERARRCSLPKLRLPRFSPEWLLLPAVLLGLLALWYGGTTLWRGLEMF